MILSIVWLKSLSILLAVMLDETLLLSILISKTSPQLQDLPKQDLNHYTFN